MLQGSQIKDAFQRIDEILLRYRWLWTHQPFMHKVLPWEEDKPEMAAFLRSLSLEQSHALETDTTQIEEALRPFLEDIAEVSALSQLTQQMPAYSEPSISPHAKWDIPGRKLEQIQAFSRSLKDYNLPFLDWCSGKGHLGRHLGSLHDRPVICLEYQEDLCEDGRRLAKRDRVEMTFHCVDVLQPQAAAFLERHQHLVALHACGPLHRRLLEEATQQRCQALHLSPCCYVRDVEETYQPFSQLAQQSSLQLTRNNVRLCLQETVVQAQRLVRRRRQLHRWRLAFDCLQRDLRSDVYSPMPSTPLTILGLGFSGFCQHMADLTGLSLPQDLDVSPYEQLGAERQTQVAAFELPRLLFRRPLELWLVLDRAAFLLEHGYEVTVGCFCPHHITPRNLLIQAHL
ncbi:MAG: methyltransferase [Myxococcales bacterium]|nr:methyltransferase [Myxococcales bacterium]